MFIGCIRRKSAVTHASQASGLLAHASLKDSQATLTGSRDSRLDSTASTSALNLSQKKTNIKKFKLIKVQRKAVNRLSQPKRQITLQDLERREHERLQKSRELLHQSQSNPLLDTEASSFNLHNSGTSADKMAAFMQMARKRFAMKRFYAPQLLASSRAKQLASSGAVSVLLQSHDSKFVNPNPWK